MPRPTGTSEERWRFWTVFPVSMRKGSTRGPPITKRSFVSPMGPRNLVRTPHCRTAPGSHYLFIHDLFTELPAYFGQGKPGRNRFYHDYLTGKGTLAEKDWIWDELFAFLTIAKTPAVNLLLSTYWTMGAVRHGDYVAKVRIAPVPAS